MLANLDANTVILLLVALTTLANTIISRQTRNAAVQTELNTNSMREQLVTATGASAHAAGLEEGRVEGRARAATLAQRVKQGQGRADKRK